MLNFVQVELLKWTRRARLLWLSNGDLNSKFFHMIAQIHNHQIKISIILNDQGCVLTSQGHIENCFAEYYSNLWKSNSTYSEDDVLGALPNDLNSLSHEDKR